MEEEMNKFIFQKRTNEKLRKLIIKMKFGSKTNL